MKACIMLNCTKNGEGEGQVSVQHHPFKDTGCDPGSAVGIGVIRPGTNLVCRAVILDLT